MKRYARIDGISVVEIIEPMVDANDKEIDISTRFHPDFVATLREIPNGQNVRIGWTCVSSTFAEPEPVTLTPDEIRINYEAAAQVMLDEFAKTWGYDSCERMISYIGSANAQWDAEGRAGRQYRDDVWSAAHSIDVAVTGGAEPPANEAEFLAMLPTPPTRPTV